MRWTALILFWAILSAVCGEPDPKKYKPEVKVRDKQTNTTLTDDEKKFLREVESKFGIKPIELEDSKKNDSVDNSKPITTKQPQPFPAVIAIEIVNDTDAKAKDKRTIDANLGYGYRTNDGYTYSYFGKPTQEKGKFMIYPYSQEDIPPTRPTFQNTRFIPHSTNKYTSSPSVEIQPSKAFELVPVKEEQTSYHYKKPVTEFKTKYESVKGLESPPPPYNSQHSAAPPSTLYTTYNGEQFSGLSGQFPMVMPNYFVDPSQLLKYPQYQSAGLTQDHLRPHGPQLERRVVPVLVLRIPSSYLKNPTAELYANLPQNYPLAQHLNNVNLQQLVNQYLKKNGYPFAPQVMSYHKPALPAQAEAPVASPISNYEPQQYANPYVRPSYTQADYSGVQYSAVQPVMAKYPSVYTNQQYYVSRPQPLYQQPIQQQQYEYQYQYVPQTVMQPQTYYVQQVQQQYQQESEEVPQQDPQGHTINDQQIDVNHAALNNEYRLPEQVTSQQTPAKPVAEYGAPHTNNAQYTTAQIAAPEEGLEYSSKNIVSPDYGSAKLSYPDYNSKPTTQYGLPKEETQQEYYSARQPVQKETIAIYPSQQSHTLQNYRINPETGGRQSYLYQKQVGEDSASKTLIISENYPSKDHTLATVLPYNFKGSKNQNSGTVQSVDYVTPVPTSKYQSQYKVMVPQTVLKDPNEKVSYVNSHSIPMHYVQAGAMNQEYNAEEEYTVATPYVPVSSQKPASYPRNYHTHPKRMVKQDNKPESNATTPKKHSDSNAKKQSQ